MVSWILLVLPDFTNTAIWMSLLTLTILEIVLGIDNIIFISIASHRLNANDRKLATNAGLLLAMLMRLLLLFGVSWLIAMNEPVFFLSFEQLHGSFSGQSLILIAGGIFLLYKSVSEIHQKLEGQTHHSSQGSKKSSLLNIIVQITLINVIFSFDSILTAVGMTSGLYGAIVIMSISIVFSVLIMMLFANPVGKFVHNHPTIQMLAMAFLILIGFMLILEGCHVAELTVAGSEVGSIPKGYLYFAITFSLGVEFLNMRLRKKAKPLELHGIQEEAIEEGLLKT